jgi:hypothetical protein
MASALDVRAPLGRYWPLPFQKGLWAMIFAKEVTTKYPVWRENDIVRRPGWVATGASVQNHLHCQRIFPSVPSSNHPSDESSRTCAAEARHAQMGHHTLPMFSLVCVHGGIALVWLFGSTWCARSIDNCESLHDVLQLEESEWHGMSSIQLSSPILIAWCIDNIWARRYR